MALRPHMAPAVDLSSAINARTQAETQMQMVRGTALRGLTSAIQDQISAKRRASEAADEMAFRRGEREATQSFQQDENRQERIARSLLEDQRYGNNINELRLQGAQRLEQVDAENASRERQAEAKARADQAVKDAKTHAENAGTEMALALMHGTKSNLYTEVEYTLQDLDPTLRGLSTDELRMRGLAARGEAGADEYVKMATKPQKGWVADPDKIAMASREIQAQYGPDGAASFLKHFEKEPMSIQQLFGMKLEEYDKAMKRDVPSRAENVNGSPAEFGQKGVVKPTIPTATNAEKQAIDAPFQGSYPLTSKMLDAAGADISIIAPPGQGAVFKDALDTWGIQVRPKLSDPSNPGGTVKGWEVLAPASANTEVVQKLQAYLDSDLGRRGFTRAALSGSNDASSGLKPEQVETRINLGAGGKGDESGGTSGSPKPSAPTSAPKQESPAPKSIGEIKTMDDIDTFLNGWKN